MVHYFATKPGKTLLNSLFSIGAAVVILGALGKINHTSWGGLALTAGMLTECIIFSLMILVPVQEHVHWERYYPDIYKDPTQEKDENGNIPPQKVTFMTGGGGSSNVALDRLDDMLQQAKIDPTNLKSLSDNFRRLNESVSNISDVSKVMSSLSDFSKKTVETNNALEGLRKSYVETASKVTNDSMGQSVINYIEELQKLTKNVNSLNAIYNIDGKEGGFSKIREYLNGIDKYTKEMADTSKDLEYARKQFNSLSSTLSDLNSIYGRMLTAMQTK